METKDYVVIVVTSKGYRRVDSWHDGESAAYSRVEDLMVRPDILEAGYYMVGFRTWKKDRWVTQLR